MQAREWTGQTGETIRQRLQRRDPLLIGLAVSALLHAAILAVRFSPPLPIRFLPAQSDLEVVLLNTQNRERPDAPEVLAQVDNVGGGDRDEGRARSPLPPQPVEHDGEQLERTVARVQQLEAEQQRLLAQARSDRAERATEDDTPPEAAEPRDDAPQADTAAEAVARMQAQIDKQVEDYNKRPRRLTYGINARSAAFARYVQAWTETIERIGTDRFPAEARGRMYDTLIVTVEVDRFGNVRDVQINRKSRHDTLNRLIKEIVLAGAPYPAFTADMVREGDLLQIVRTWTFTSDQLRTSAARR